MQIIFLHLWLDAAHVYLHEISVGEWLQNFLYGEGVKFYFLYFLMIEICWLLVNVVLLANFWSFRGRGEDT